MGLHVVQATSLAFRTMPFIILRFLIYSVFGIVTIGYFAAVYFIGQGVAHLHEYARIATWIVGLILPFPIVRLVQEYLLYVVKAGHVAVLAELATKGSLPEGVGQIAWGKQRVKETFKQASALFLVDRLVAGVIGAINGIMWRVGGFFSAIPGLQGIVKFAQLILRFSLTYVDEAILARNFLKKEESIWQSAKVGLVLYAQIWKQVLGTAVILGLAAMISYGALAAVLVIPAWGAGEAMANPKAQGILIIGALVLAAILKLAFLDPWTLSNMILTYLKETEGLAPDKAWEEKLEGMSKKFKQIKQKALAPASAPIQAPAS